MVRIAAAVFVAVALSGCSSPDGLGDVYLSSGSLSFESTIVGHEGTADLSLENRGDSPAQVQLETAPPFAVSESALLIAPGAERTTVIRFRPTEPGSFDGSLVLRSGKRSASVKLVAKATETPTCQGPAQGICTTLAWNPATAQCGPTKAPDGTACQTSCIPSGACFAGECVGAEKFCDDGTACTVDACSAGACFYNPVVCATPSHPCRKAICNPSVGCEEVDAESGTLCGVDSCGSWSACWAGKCTAETSETPNCELPSCGGMDLTAPLCADGWCYENPLPGGDRLYSVWGSDASNVWFVGTGSALHWDGEKLRGWDLPGILPLHEVAGSARDNVWAVGPSGTIVRFDGKAWSAFSGPLVTEYGAVWTSGPNDVWVGTTYSGPLYQWNGIAWMNRQHMDGVVRMVGTDPTSLLVATAGGYVYRRTGTSSFAYLFRIHDGMRDLVEHSGVPWALGAYRLTRQKPPNQTEDLGNFTDATGLWVGASDDAVVTTSSGQSFHYDGSTWRMVEDGPAYQPPPYVYPAMLWGRARNDLWSVSSQPGESGEIRHWDGRYWKSLSCGERATVRDIHALDSTNVWAATDEGPMERTPAGWTLRELDFKHLANAIWVAGPNDVWAGSVDGNLHRWDGSTWTAYPIGTTQRISGIWGASPDDVWAVGGAFESVIRHWDGNSWTSYSSPTPQVALEGVWGTSADNVYAVGSTNSGSYSVVLRWDGTSWTEFSRQNSMRFTGVHGSSASDLWVTAIVSSGGRVARWDGTQWSFPLVRTGLNYFGVYSTGAGEAWFATSTGTARYSNGAWSYDERHGVLRSVSGAHGSLWVAGEGGKILRLAP